MNAIFNTAISPFVLILRRSGLLTEDLDYHLVRASMVIMFFFFGYQKWWPYEAERLVPFISNGVRPLGCKLVSRCFRMDLRRPAACRILGQAARNSGRRRFDRDLHRHRHDHSLHAGWLGPCGRISGDDRQRPLPDEGRRAAGRIALSVEAGRGARHAAMILRNSNSRRQATACRRLSAQRNQHTSLALT